MHFPSDPQWPGGQATSKLSMIVLLLKRVDTAGAAARVTFTPRVAPRLVMSPAAIVCMLATSAVVFLAAIVADWLERYDGLMRRL